MGRVSGKVALITGAARGQGRSHAVRLAEEGADIIAFDICAPVEGIAYDMATPEDLEETRKLVEKRGARIVTAEVDIRERRALSEAMDEAVAELGRLDVVVANAGVAVVALWNGFTQQQWDATIGVNLTGTWNTLNLGAAHLVAGGGGSMIVTSSVAGVVGLPFTAPYVAAKHGVVGITRALANELAEHNIRVNAICPTSVRDTGMFEANEGIDPDVFESASERLLVTFTNAMMTDTVEPVDISNAVLYLASDESRFVTGNTMPVDAGQINL